MYRYVPYEQLAGQSNIIVGGHATAGTQQIITPWAADYAAETNFDTAVGMAFQLLRGESSVAHCQAVSSDCFSTDRLMTIFALTEPELALEMEETLVAIARAANYQIAEDRDIAHMSFVIKSWTEPAVSPLNESVFRQSQTTIATILFEELLPRLANIVNRIDRLEHYWRDEEEQVTFSESLLEAGAVQVTNDEGLGLVQIALNDSDSNKNGAGPFPLPPGQTLHPMAIHNCTPHWRVLLQAGHRFHFYCRNETLAACHQARTNRQIELSDLAESLNRRENYPDKWRVTKADRGCSANPPPRGLHLNPGLESELTPEIFRQILQNLLNA